MSEFRDAMRELADILRHIKLLLEVCEAGPERDQMQGRYDRTFERFMALPKRVADQGPFETAAHAHAVLTKECAYVVAAIDGAN
jgi:hypothetical protein